MYIEKINAQSVADSVSEKLKNCILAGSLKPGDKLPSERNLASELNVSRMSLRQGIVLLTEVGLLEARKGGTYVCDVISPSLVEPFGQLFSWYPKAFADMLELRLLLQNKAMGLAIDLICPSDKDIMAFFYERMQTAFDKDDVDEILESIKDLHLAIIDCSYNLVLSTVLRGILSLLQQSLSREISKSQLNKLQFVQECLYKAIIQRDSAIAESMLQRHIELIQELNTQAAMPKQDDLDGTTPYRIDKAVARIEHLVICQHFETEKPLPPLKKLKLVIDEEEDIIKSALLVLIEKEKIIKTDGNTYLVKEVNTSLISDPLSHLINTNWKVALDVFDLRIALERNSAYQAAENKDHEKRNYLKHCLNRLLSSDTEYDAHSNALDDYEFHLAIADLSNNLATTYLMRGLFNLLRGSISNWLALFNEEVGDISIIQKQHVNIYEAIVADTADNASAAMYEHLHYVITTVQQIAAKKEREVYAMERKRYLENKFIEKKPNKSNS